MNQIHNDSNSNRLFDCDTETSFSILPESNPENKCTFSVGISFRQKISQSVNWSLKILFVLAALSVCFIALRLCFPASETASGKLPDITNNTDYCNGNGWIAYRDEMCFKLVKKWATRDEANSACRQELLPSELEAPQLASIQNEEEQSFLAKLIFTDSKLDVWIGARRNATNESLFSWEDGTPVIFTAWDSATDLSVEKNCVEVHKVASTGDHSIQGKWRLAACERANYFVCQKPQRWLLEKLQRAFLTTRRSLSIQMPPSQIANQAGIPLGFTYIQLPSQSSPTELWPQMSWLDISGNFSGVFLRIAGNGAADFGTFQEENAGGQIREVKFSSASRDISKEAYLSPGKCSSVGSVHDQIGSQGSLEFCTRDGDIRPRNMAVKIWKRIE